MTKTVRCLTPDCGESLVKDEYWGTRVWVHRARGWGIIGSMVYCPQHSGRKRTRPVIPEVLPGQLSMFHVPEGAIVPKRKKSKKPTP